MNVKPGGIEANTRPQYIFLQFFGLAEDPELLNDVLSVMNI